MLSVERQAHLPGGGRIRHAGCLRALFNPKAMCYHLAWRERGTTKESPHLLVLRAWEDAGAKDNQLAVHHLAERHFELRVAETDERRHAERSQQVGIAHVRGRGSRGLDQLI